MAIASVADLRNYMSGVSLSAKQEAAAQMALDGAQEDLELYLGRPVQPVQVREARRANAVGDIALTVTPVIRVLSLRSVSATEATEYTAPVLVPLADVADDATRNYDTAPEQAWIVPGGIVVGAGYGYYVVEYVGGYNGWGDKGLKLAILEVASRTMTVNHDDVLSIKDDVAREPANAASIQKGWREDELVKFDRIRRRTAYR